MIMKTNAILTADSLEYSLVLPVVVPGTPSTAGERAVLPHVRTSGGSGIPRLSALPAQVVQRQRRIQRREGDLPLHRAASRRTADSGSPGQGISAESFSLATPVQGGARHYAAR